MFGSFNGFDVGPESRGVVFIVIALKEVKMELKKGTITIKRAGMALIVTVAMLIGIIQFFLRRLPLPRG